MRHPYSFAVSVASALALVSVSLFSAPTQASAAVLAPECTVTMDNPHYSDGADGVIAKARFVCAGGISQTYYNVTLYVFGPCSSALPEDKGASWPSRCGSSYKVEPYGTISLTAGQSKTRYVPDTGGKGLPDAYGNYRAYVKYRLTSGGTMYYKYSQNVSGPY